MRKVLYGFLGFTVMFVFASVFDFVELNIGHAQKELESEIVNVDNSVLKTLKHFSQTEDRDMFNADIIVLNFWYPYCGSCVREIPLLNELKDKFKGTNIKFLAYQPKSAYRFDTQEDYIASLNFQFEEISFNSGVKKSITTVAEANEVEVNKLMDIYPSTFIVSVKKDSVLYAVQRDIKEGDMPTISQIIENEIEVP